jgi:hypothetical protein
MKKLWIENAQRIEKLNHGFVQGEREGASAQSQAVKKRPKKPGNPPAFRIRCPVFTNVFMNQIYSLCSRPAPFTTFLFESTLMVYT